VQRHARAAAAELIGTAALLLVIVGSGIMGERLSPHNAAIALLANAIATGLGLFVLIGVFAPVSQAHFNPVVTLAAVLQRQFPRYLAIGYILVQGIGAIAGVWLAHAMFDLPIVQSGGKIRTGAGQWLSEVVATAGLLLTIAGFSRHGPKQVAAAVGAYIAAAYWFTASTSFANPAVTMARALTDTFAGIRATDAPAFIGAQVLGMLAGVAASRFLFGARASNDSLND
jgi:glycerol uptake facilitator-like aquaporin